MLLAASRRNQIHAGEEPLADLYGRVLDGGDGKFLFPLLRADKLIRYPVGFEHPLQPAEALAEVEHGRYSLPRHGADVLQAAHRLFSAQIGQDASVCVSVIPIRLDFFPLQNGKAAVLSGVYIPM